MLSEQGVREVTLLGQNVNSYADFSRAASSASSSSGSGVQAAADDPFAGVYARGFRRCGKRWPSAGDGSMLRPEAELALCMHARTSCVLPARIVWPGVASADVDTARAACNSARSVYKPRRDGAATFAELLDAVAGGQPNVRLDLHWQPGLHACTPGFMPAQGRIAAALHQSRLPTCIKPLQRRDLSACASARLALPLCSPQQCVAEADPDMHIRCTHSATCVCPEACTATCCCTADVDPEMRIRFTSPHPKDFSDDVLSVSCCCARFELAVVAGLLCMT